MLKARPLAAGLSILVCLASAVSAHPSGASRVDVIIREDTVEARVDVNRDDLFYALGFKQMASGIPHSEYGPMADRIAYYFQTRMDLKFDGGTADMKVLQYKKHGGDPAAKMDSADFMDTTIALRVAWPIPKQAKRMEVGSKLFAELEVQPICHLRIHYKDQELKSKFMDVDDRISLPVQRDSLEALRAAAMRPVAPSGGTDAPSSDEGSVVWRFVRLGFTHILPEGTDHILFVLGLFFFSVLLRPLLLQVTAFTIAHSLTLGLSLLGVFSLPSRVVEPLIALSIVVVAVENIFFRKLRPSRFLIVFAFGLIHGLGFAGVLKTLGLPEGQFLKVLVSFNVGVELGQLTVIAAAAALTVWMWKKPWYRARVVIPASALIAAVGLFWFFQRILWVQG